MRPGTRLQIDTAPDRHSRDLLPAADARYAGSVDVRTAAIERLEMPGEPEPVLLELVRWLDVTMAGRDAPSLEHEILARGVAALGRELLARERAPHVEATLRAATAFALEPTLDRYDALVAAATDTYPFGPGDGCFAIPALGVEGCAPGSGCRSGAGTLAAIAEEISYEVAVDALRAGLLPWLRGSGSQSDTRPRVS